MRFFNIENVLPEFLKKRNVNNTHPTQNNKATVDSLRFVNHITKYETALIEECNKIHTKATLVSKSNLEGNIQAQNIYFNVLKRSLNDRVEFIFSFKYSFKV